MGRNGRQQATAAGDGSGGRAQVSVSGNSCAVHAVWVPAAALCSPQCRLLSPASQTHLNCRRSATAPETMVAAVPANVQFHSLWSGGGKGGNRLA